MEVELPARTWIVFSAAVLGSVTPSSGGDPTTKEVLHAKLTAGAEVPGPGKKGAAGSATIKLYPPRRICYFVDYRNIPDATAAHVHEGAAGKSGPPVITMRNIERGRIEGCTTGSHGFMFQLWNFPQKYYVNIHSPAFPDGAVRGQLRR